MSSKTHHSVEGTAFEDAAQLIDALRPSHPFWQANDPQDWLFRGQRDASWALTPSALRNIAADNDSQVAQEYAQVSRFYRLADAQGLARPGDSPALEESLTGPSWPAEAPWPSRETYAISALAQHFGVSTRLLDWSRKSLVGAWFAAEGAARAHKEDKKTERMRAVLDQAGVEPAKASQAVEEIFGRPADRLAVWALCRKGKGASALTQAGVRLVTAPRASNPNLHMQSGLLTVRPIKRKEREGAGPVDGRPLEALLIEEAKCEVDEGGLRTPDGTYILRKLTLSADQAGVLLWHLRDRFVQGVVIYSGYAGVARSVEELTLRGKRPSAAPSAPGRK